VTFTGDLRYFFKLNFDSSFFTSRRIFFLCVRGTKTPTKTASAISGKDPGLKRKTTMTGKVTAPVMEERETYLVVTSIRIKSSETSGKAETSFSGVKFSNTGTFLQS